MSPELEAKLIDKYPTLFRDVNQPPTASLMCFGCECDDGWYDLLDRTFQKIIDLDIAREITLVQVKEKYGALRVYFNGGDNELDHKVYDILNKAEDESIKFCERCGTTEEVKKTEGWIKYLCPICTENRYK
jgi:hypothetical protein